MGWDKSGRYYTRSRREDGRVVREYIGGGRAGELVARMDACDRDRRATERQCARFEREEIEALDEALRELGDVTDLWVRAVLVTAGFRRHNRGEWRKRRG